jgi:hypothetical protein
MEVEQMSKDDDLAQRKGAADFKRSTKTSALQELFGSSFRPPSGKEKPYKDAWKNAKKQHEKKQSKKSWW